MTLDQLTERCKLAGYLLQLTREPSHVSIGQEVRTWRFILTVSRGGRTVSISDENVRAQDEMVFIDTCWTAIHLGLGAG